MSAAGIFLSTEELERAMGLPHAARLMYLELRQRMDYESGRVGQRMGRYISWRGLAEGLYVEPHPGVKAQTFSEQQVRRAAAWLVKAGLIQMESNGAQWHLIFFLPVAHRVFLSRKKPTGTRQDKPTGLPQRENPPKADNPKRAKADKHQGVYINTTTGSADVSPSATDEREGIQWPPMGATEKAHARAILQSIPDEQAQQLLDEMAGAQAKGAIQRGPVAYLRGLVKMYESGAFNPDKGRAIAASRARSPQVQQSDAPASPEAAPASKAAARAHIAATLKQLKGAGHAGTGKGNS